MTPSFDNLRVLSFESRRAKEMASIISSYGGQPVSAPSMREVPLDSNPDAMAFADALERGEFDLVVLLTGVGTEALFDVARPKPVAVLRELTLTPWLTAPEPNTWREAVSALDDKQDEFPLSGKRVAVQEYGASNPDLLAALELRGAQVTRVPVYQWALPEDLGPLEAAVRAIAGGQIDVALFTTATQVVHLLKIADSMEMGDAVRRGLTTCVVASIGPTTSEEMREQGITPDMEPTHPKMGFLVREAAERASEILQAKRT